jgi:hypothetical protein
MDNTDFIKAFYIVPIDPVTHEAVAPPHSFTNIDEDNPYNFFALVNAAIQSSRGIDDDGIIHRVELYADDTLALEEYIRLDGEVDLPSANPDSNS